MVSNIDTTSSSPSFEKEKEVAAEKRATYGTRTFHLITGILVTPTEMLSGSVLLVFSIAKLAVASFVRLCTKISTKKLPSTISEQKIDRTHPHPSSFVALAVHDIQISLLKMIPIIGAQLANQYNATGSLQGFIDSPAIGGALTTLGLTISRLVYGFRGNFTKDSESYKEAQLVLDFQVCEQKEYLQLKKPTHKDAIEQINHFLSSPKFSTSQGITVRIPTQDGYHDGTMLFASPINIQAKTVVLYHGNAEHRDFKYRLAQQYQTKGYNVLLASYAGDPVTQGNETSSKEVVQPCTELRMRRDAAADYAFLKALGITHMATHGYSLGGAQAMNFAQAIADDPTVSVDFIHLDRTFTSMPDVIKNCTFNIAKSRFLARLAYNFTKKFIADETPLPYRNECDGLNNAEKLKQILTKPNFATTKFCFLGMTEDPLMGAPEREDKHNFAQDLYETAAHLGTERVYQDLQTGRHDSWCSYDSSIDFVTTAYAARPTTTLSS